MKKTINTSLIFFGLLVICVLLETAWVAPKVKTWETRPFLQSGQLVSLDKLFGAVESATIETAQRRPSLGVVLVTRTGVFSFLETPANEKHLQRVPLGSFVELSGELLVSGRLLQIEQLDLLKERQSPQIDLKKIQKTVGRPVKLVGKNLCQCGLEVGSLAHGCQLGHLHHLQTEEGEIYHYLPGGEGSELFLGGPNHYKTVEVTGQEFPGHYLLVTSSHRLE